MGQSASSSLDLTPQGGISAKHTQAWLPFLSFAGANSAALSAAIQKLIPQSTSSIAPSATVPLNDLLTASKLTPSSASALLSSFESEGGNLALTPLLQTRVSREDLLIVLNLFLEDVAAAEFNADAMDESSPTAASSSSANSVAPAISPDSLLAHIAPTRLVSVQEQLDALVEEAGPQAEGQPIPKTELQKVLKAAGVPLIQWALFATTFAQSVKEQGLEGEASSSAASSSSSSSAAGVKKPAASKAAASSSGAAGGLGGGLDLSISGFSIKPPPGFNASAGVSAAPKKK